MPRAAAIAAALAALGATAAPALAEPTRSQEFFRKEILADRGTSDEIVHLLRDGGGFVARKVTFADLTADGRQDAVVRVHSGGAAGVVALFVFTTHGRERTDRLRVVYARQRLIRAAARVSRRSVLSFRSAIYTPGDPVCCPSEGVRTVLRWDAERERFRVRSSQPVE